MLLYHLRVIYMLLDYIFGLNRISKRVISISYDAFALVFSFLVSTSLRIGHLGVQLSLLDVFLIGTSILFSLLVFSRLGLYRAVLRYIGTQAIVALLVGVTTSTLLLITTAFFTQSSIARSVPVIYWFTALVMVGGPRWVVRYLYLQYLKQQKTPVIVFGAGNAGQQLLNSFQSDHEYKVVAVIDDDPKKYRTTIHGVSVYSMVELQSLIDQHEVKTVLLALGSANRSTRKTILDRLESYPVEVLTIPSMADVVAGRASIEEFKEVDIDDLLGRDSVEPDHELLSRCITGKVVMVTGAGGSIGSELCRQICKQKPKALVLFELTEFALYSIEQELNTYKKAHSLDFPIYPFMGSVQHRNRLTEIMRLHKVQTVYHAAAYKHVPLVELNVIEGVRNNVFGTWFTAEAAIKARVETFVLVSTDKAVRPTNVMGATKRLAELVLQSKAFTSNQSVRFCMVRFGNVLGSSGSVVPLFRKQIRAGGPVTLTHSEITRYFMTIPEASQLVIQAGSMGKGGDVFVLDMGESVRIMDLATRMIRLMGLSVHSHDQPGDIEIIHSGLRPGEKLYEELLVGENVQGTDHPKIMTAQEEYLSWAEMNLLLKQLDLACHAMDCEKIRELILEAPVGYNPQHEVKDMLWELEPESRSADVVDLKKGDPLILR